MSADLVYAECTNCDATFADRDEASAHGSATMAAVENPVDGVIARGHGWRVLNPSPEEARENKVRSTVTWAIDDAVNEFINEMDRCVERGDLTAEDVTEQLRIYPDFADGWDEYLAENA